MHHLHRLGLQPQPQGNLGRHGPCVAGQVHFSRGEHLPLSLGLLWARGRGWRHEQQCCPRVPETPGPRPPQSLTFSIIKVHSLASYWSTWGSWEKGTLVSTRLPGQGQCREQSWRCLHGCLGGAFTLRWTCWSISAGMLPASPDPSCLSRCVAGKRTPLQEDLLAARAK